MNKIISLWDVFWPFFKRKFWYALLLVSSTLYLGYNRFAIVRLDDSSLISAVFLVWIILLLFPLFSELEFLGIKIKKKVKKEVEKNNEELKSTIHLLQGQISQIQIATGIANRISITNETMSLEELKKLVSKVGNQENPNHKSEKRKNVPAPVIEMFEIRYEIECELKRLCQKSGMELPYATIGKCIDALLGEELMSLETVQLIGQVSQITSRIIHGEKMEKQYLDIVEGVYPQIIKELKLCENRIVGRCGSIEK